MLTEYDHQPSPGAQLPTELIEVVTLKQVTRVNPQLLQTLTETAAAKDFFQQMIGDEAREVVAILGLDGQKHPVVYAIVFTGSAETCVAHPREIFQRLLLNNCQAFLLAHNHPSGSLTPSRADERITKRLVAAGELMGIELYDHIIVTEQAAVSLYETDPRLF